LNGIVNELDFDINIVTKQSALHRVLRKTGKARKGVAWQHAAKMTDYISLVIIFGCFD
jgi:hypothetical protein